MAPAVRDAETVSAKEDLVRIGPPRSLARNAAHHFDGINNVASPTLCVAPPLMSEIGERQSYLDVKHRIVRNR